MNKKKIILISLTVIIIIIVLTTFIIVKKTQETNETLKKEEAINNFFTNYGKTKYTENMDYYYYVNAIQIEYLRNLYLYNKSLRCSEIIESLPKSNHTCEIIGEYSFDKRNEYICYSGDSDLTSSLILDNVVSLSNFFEYSMKEGRKFSEDELLSIGLKQVDITKRNLTFDDVVNCNIINTYFIGLDGYYYNYHTMLGEDGSLPYIKESDLKVASLFHIEDETDEYYPYNILLMEDGTIINQSSFDVIFTKEQLKHLENASE